MCSSDLPNDSGGQSCRHPEEVVGGIRVMGHLEQLPHHLDRPACRPGGNGDGVGDCVVTLRVEVQLEPVAGGEHQNATYIGVRGDRGADVVGTHEDAHVTEVQFVVSGVEQEEGHGGPESASGCGGRNNRTVTATGSDPSVPALLRAYHGQRPGRLPVWFMRQAGRSLPEYREARAGIGMLEACTTPDLVAEITAQPVRRHGVDAGILFSDIVTPLYVAGVDVEIRTGVGPVFADPVTDDAALARLITRDPADLSVITEAARRAAEAIPVPLIGFAGAPFTLAAYAVEGRSSRDHLAARTLMHAEPELWDRLMTWMADQSGAFLAAQVAGGARAVQLFDSWEIGRAHV